MQKNIYLIRHGETEFNRRHMVQGSGVDSDLNETGKIQGQSFYDHYKDIPFEIALTSALKRTHQTVHPFIETGLAWEQFPEINEMSWGIHEGKERSEELRASYEYTSGEWEKGNYNARIEGGESINEVVARCQIFVEQLRNRTEKTLLICAHGRLNRCLLCVLLNEPLSKMDDFEHTNTGLYQLKFEDDQFELIFSNDTRHLQISEPITT